MGMEMMMMSGAVTGSVVSLLATIINKYPQLLNNSILEPKLMMIAGSLVSVILTVATFFMMQEHWVSFSFNINEDVIFPVPANMIKFRNAIFTTSKPMDVTSILNDMAAAHSGDTTPPNFKLVGKLTPLSFNGGVAGHGATLRGEYKKL